MKLARRGFTLIELMVTISIISLIASIILASLNDARARARDAKRLADIHNLKNAVHLYYSGNNSYPLMAANDSAGWDVSNVGSFIQIPEQFSDPQNSDPYHTYYYRTAPPFPPSCPATTQAVIHFWTEKQMAQLGNYIQCVGQGPGDGLPAYGVCACLE